MERKSRRKILAGMLAGVGVATVAATAMGRTAPKEKKAPESSDGTILYHRNAESERYYKTLYT